MRDKSVLSKVLSTRKRKRADEYVYYTKVLPEVCRWGKRTVLWVGRVKFLTKTPILSLDGLACTFCGWLFFGGQGISLYP